MKKLITLLLLFTLVGFLSGNQVIITNDYQYIVSTGKTYNFANGNPSNNVKYDRTNKIAIQNNKVLADPLKYHYAFFWDEANDFIGYYKTNKGIATNGAYLGQVNTQSIPLPLNAYSFALVRYDNDYQVVPGITIEDIFIDSDNYFSNTIQWNTLNSQTLNQIFVNNTTNLLTVGWTSDGTSSLSIDSNNNLVQTSSNSSFYMYTFSHGLSSSNTYYVYSVFTTNNNFGTILMDFGGSGFSDSINNGLANTIYFLSFAAPFGTGNGSIGWANSFPTATTNIVVNSTIKYINMTSLGITSLTVSQLDNYFNLFENINDNDFVYTGYSTDFINPTFAFNSKLLNLTSIFGAGNEPNQATIEQYYADYEEYLEYLYVCCDIFATQTISFETIYFDDGVSTEIERLGSILIFTLIGFTLMIFGFASKRRIFNLLSIGAFIVLGVLLAEFAGFLIIVFGLVVLNLYYTFLGDI
jgi:hypothetical protein